jgi:type III pantothenate kinase
LILDLDIGNTRCKWRLRGPGCSSSGAVALEDLIAGALSVQLNSKVRRVRIASVRGEPIRQSVEQWCLNCFHIAPEFAVSERYCAGVTNSYADSHRLGVDRWLAMLAAYAEIKSSFCVIDCGSAITADLVDNDGRHIGGYISPGLNMMRNSLRRDTDRVKLETLPESLDQEPGTDTLHAVVAGTTLAAVGMILQAIARCRDVSGQPRTVITGGDGAELQKLLGVNSLLRPELVLDGLAIALPDRM